MSKSTVPFTGTKEQSDELLAFINEYGAERGSLLPTLQKAQEIYGYLPIEVQEIVARGLNLSLSEVYGVATFYAQFSLYPKGQYRISVCLGTACYVKGSGEVLDRVQQELGITMGESTPDGKFSIEECRCLGACGLAPVMTINSEVYGRITPDMIPDILAKY
ncbi:MAG: NAD(P)H-dependent oxidoreductase subunit E [Oscillospiraceae bacterium]